MVILPDHSIITVGDRYETSTFARTGYLLKVDADGNEQWNRQLSSNAELYGSSICLLPNGNVFVAGYDYDVPNRNFGIVVAEYNSSNGLPVYQHTHEFGKDAEARDVVPMADNGAIVLSTYEDASTKTNMLVRFNSDGDTLWTKLVDPYPGKEDPKELQLVSNGLVITGSVHSGSSDNVLIIGTDMDGNIQWQQEYTSSGLEFGEAITPNPSGGYYVAGTTNDIGNGGLDLLAMKVDASGQVLWRKGFGRSGNELGYDVALMPDGGAVFTGSLYPADTASFRDLGLIRTNADGDTLWTRYFGGVRTETGYEVQVDGNTIVVCGKADVNNSEDIIILRADFDGNAAVGIHETTAENRWNIYPNPFTESINISSNSPANRPISMEVLDLSGRVLSRSTVTHRTSLNLAWLPSGTYLLRIENMFTTPIVKIQ